MATSNVVRPYTAFTKTRPSTPSVFRFQVHYSADDAVVGSHPEPMGPPARSRIGRGAYTASVTVPSSAMNPKLSR